MTRSVSELLGRIEERSALIGVVGLGYVGLPLAATFAEAGFDVIGIDSDAARVEAIKEGTSYVKDVPDEWVARLAAAGKLKASESYAHLTGADAIIICVPTPLTDGTPDLSSVIAAGGAVSSIVTPSTLVVLESTTYPGTTEELLRPILLGGGRVREDELLLAFSPERIDPGNPFYAFKDIPKVVGGVDDASTKVATALYQEVVPKVVVVSGPKEAELSKLIENTFRHVNIALVNELAVYAHEFGIDVWEAIEAAATKPFGFLPFWPGPGWGGHCIPLDPAYLSWAVRRDMSRHVRFIELASAVNSEMPRHVVDRVTELLNDRGRSVRGARVLGIGVSYKPGTDDLRESPGLRVLSLLARRGATISYHDPLVPEVSIEDDTLKSIDLSVEVLRGQDIVLALVAQTGVDWQLVGDKASLVLDCCNALGRKDERIIRL